MFEMYTARDCHGTLGSQDFSNMLTNKQKTVLISEYFQKPSIMVS